MKFKTTFLKLTEALKYFLTHKSLNCSTLPLSFLEFSYSELTRGDYHIKVTGLIVENFEGDL